MNYKLSDWLTCKDELLKLEFTEEEIDKALEDIKYTIRDLTDVKEFQREPTFMKVYELVKSNVKFKIKQYQGEWEKEVYVTGSEYRIKAEYQGLKHGNLIFQLFNNRYAYFNSFTELVIENVKPSIHNWTRLKDVPEDFYNISVKELVEMTNGKDIQVEKSLWTIYQLHRDNAEMYLKTEFGTLYVPFKAIIDKNWKIINDRMITYCLFYCDPINLSGYGLNHRGRTKEEYKLDKEKDYNNMIKPLESKEALKLKEFLT